MRTLSTITAISVLPTLSIAASFPPLLTAMMLRWEYLVSGLLACGVVIILDRLLGTLLLHQRRFHLYLGVMLLCQLVFDGYLTARPVTLYNPCCYLGPRLPFRAMPIEDFPFGMALAGLVVVLWEWTKKR